MSERNRKILIVTLVVVMLAVIGFIIFTFKKPSTDQTGQTQTKSAFSFADLILRKKPSPTGSQIDTGSQGTDLGNQGVDQNGQGSTGVDLSPGLGTGSELSSSGQLSTLPDPGSLLSGGLGGQGSGQSGGNVIIPPGGGSGGSGNKDICNDPNISQKLRDQLCGIGVNTNPTIKTGFGSIPFTLNDEEQAELDRLSRAFARIAPYLKTDGDVSREQANNEAYNDFVSTSIKLAQKTDTERLASGYKGPIEVFRPFLSTADFSPSSQLSDEIFGRKRVFQLSLWRLIRGKDEGSDKDDEDTVRSGIAGSLGGALSNRLIDIIFEFSQKQGSTKVANCQLSSTSSTDDLDSLQKKCGFNIFEETLNIQ